VRYFWLAAPSHCGRRGTSRCAADKITLTLAQAFAARAEQCAFLWSIRFYDLTEAADILQGEAERTGLINAIGRDAVQAIMSNAFRPYRQQVAVLI
jgi:hypothetical protein